MGSWRPNGIIVKHGGRNEFSDAILINDNKRKTAGREATARVSVWEESGGWREREWQGGVEGRRQYTKSKAVLLGIWKKRAHT